MRFLTIGFLALFSILGTNAIAFAQTSNSCPDTTGYQEAYDYYCIDPTFSKYKEASFATPAELSSYCVNIKACLNGTFNDYTAIDDTAEVLQKEGERVDSFVVSIKVNRDASIDVAETITYNFDAESKHGIYRDVPINYRTKTGLKMRLDLRNISVTDENNHQYQFTTSKNGNDRRIKIGDPDVLITGTHTYVIKYSVPLVVGFFKDFDEIYWNAIGTGWQIPIHNVTVTVELPSVFKKSDLTISCYSGFSDSTDECDSYGAVESFDSDDSSIHEISFAQKYLNPYEGITVAVGFPKGVVVEPPYAERFWIGFLSAGWYWLILPILIFIFMYRRWSKYGRDPKGTGVIVPEYDVPDGLSPMQIRFIFKQSFGNSLSAEIVYLATKGYLKISKVTDKGVFISKDDYELEKLKLSDGALNTFQAALLNGLFEPNMVALNSATEIARTITLANSDKNASKMTKIAAHLVEGMAAIGAKKDIESSQRLVENKVRLSDLQYRFFTVSNMIERYCESTLVEKGYFPEGKKTYSTYSATIGNKKASRAGGIIVGAVFFLIFGSTFIGIFFQNALAVIAYDVSVLIWTIFQILMSRMSEKGVHAKEHISGFKLYLSVAERDRINFHNAPTKNPEQFEKFLPYAMALGVEKEWAKVFEGIDLPQPNWYNDSSLSAFSAGAFASNMTSFSTASNSSLASTPGSSSGSGGGGSSGGGGGGGGGGSW
ncbi:MAG: DUF2207 domain-containing protein [Candidatus Taylorbacteria bacterium]